MGLHITKEQLWKQDEKNLKKTLGINVGVGGGWG